MALLRFAGMFKPDLQDKSLLISGTMYLKV